MFSPRSKKERVYRGVPLFIRRSTFRKETRPSLPFCFPEGISLSRRQKSAVGRLPPLENSRACFIFPRPCRPSSLSISSLHTFVDSLILVPLCLQFVHHSSLPQWEIYFYFAGFHFSDCLFLIFFTSLHCIFLTFFRNECLLADFQSYDEIMLIVFCSSIFVFSISATADEITRSQLFLFKVPNFVSFPGSFLLFIWDLKNTIHKTSLASLSFFCQRVFRWTEQLSVIKANLSLALFNQDQVGLS